MMHYNFGGELDLHYDVLFISRGAEFTFWSTIYFERSRIYILMHYSVKGVWVARFTL